jgi:hypothetical protein
MTIFTFTSAAAAITDGSLNLGAADFYAHLVKTLPVAANTVVSDVTIADYTNYSPVLITSPSFSAGVFSFPNLEFPRNLGPQQSLLGFVVCQRLGPAPAASDPLVLYSSLRQANTPVTIPINTGEQLRVVIDQVNGVLRTEQRHLFASGNFVTDFDANGSIFQIGSRNGTQAYVNPSNSRIIGYSLVSSGTANPDVNFPLAFDRGSGFNFTFGSGEANIIRVLDFGALRIRLLNSEFWCHLEAVGGGNPVNGFRIFGAKFLENFNASTINNLANWTPLMPATDIPGTPSGTRLLRFPIPGNPEFYRFIGIFGGTNTGGNKPSGREMEFYNATIASPTANLAP